MERETYLAERRELITSEADQARLYDRAILTLSGGALGLTLVFIRDVVPKLREGTEGYLIAGWGFLIVSLLATLISFHTSQLALRRQREILDDTYEPSDKREIRAGKPVNMPGIWTNFLNWLSLAAFIMGTISLIWFVTGNMI